MVQQLLMVELVPQPETWAPIVSGAAQAVAVYLSPAQMFANGQHDPRQSLKVRRRAEDLLAWFGGVQHAEKIRGRSLYRRRLGWVFILAVAQPTDLSRLAVSRAPGLPYSLGVSGGTAQEALYLVDGAYRFSHCLEKVTFSSAAVSGSPTYC